MTERFLVRKDVMVQADDVGEAIEKAEDGDVLTERAPVAVKIRPKFEEAERNFLEMMRKMREHPGPRDRHVHFHIGDEGKGKSYSVLQNHVKDFFDDLGEELEWYTFGGDDGG